MKIYKKNLLLELRAKHFNSLWQYGLWSFQTGGTKLGRFLPENPQRKLLNFENWISGGPQNFSKIRVLEINYTDASLSLPQACF